MSTLYCHCSKKNIESLLSVDLFYLTVYDSDHFILLCMTVIILSYLYDSDHFILLCMAVITFWVCENMHCGQYVAHTFGRKCVCERGCTRACICACAWVLLCIGVCTHSYVLLMERVGVCVCVCVLFQRDNPMFKKLNRMVPLTVQNIVQ